MEEGGLRISEEKNTFQKEDLMEAMEVAVDT
jgi:hypothetical protein